MKKVLIAVDGGKSSITDVKYGIRFAQQNHAEIGIVEVTNLSIGSIDAGIMPEDEEKANQYAAKVNLSSIKLNYPQLSIKEFEPIGKPEVEIEKIVGLWQPDLLVIGHQTHSAWYKLFNPDVESELISQISIPMLIIPEKYKI